MPNTRNSKRDRFIEITPTFAVSTGAYAQYDAVGTLPVNINGQGICLKNVSAENGKCVELVHISGAENTGQTPSYSLYFFTDRPHGTFVDNGAIVWGSGDFNRRTGMVKIVSGDWSTNPSSLPDATCDLSGISQILAPADDSRDLWLIIVADVAYDAGEAPDLILKFKFDRGADTGG